MKKPWNLINLPVYSLASGFNGIPNYNICTYVSAVSMKPKLYAVAVYQGTQTLRNVEQEQYFVLQLLSEEDYKLVNVLGKKSGLNYSKFSYLNKKEVIENWNGYQVLKNCAALIELKKISFVKTGDHNLFLFEALRYTSRHSNILTSKILNEKGIIRA